MRVVLDQEPVVERRRLALVAVDAHERFLPILRKEAPLQAARKACAAATAQLRILHDARRPCRGPSSSAPCATPGSPRATRTPAAYGCRHVPVAAQDGFKGGHGQILQASSALCSSGSRPSFGRTVLTNHDSRAVTGTSRCCSEAGCPYSARRTGQQVGKPHKMVLRDRSRSPSIPTEADSNWRRNARAVNCATGRDSW